jgi:prepilin-type N-terminal cleavage/methylation domain-containing protein
MHSRKRAFTLIELLVVISIIALLAALALPALQGALNAAKKARANTMCQQLKVAVTAFNTEYGTWPGPPQQVLLDQSTLYHSLIGATTANPTDQYNTRGITFMEFATKDLDNATAPTMFVDPWYISNKKQPTQNYQIAVDATFVGSINIGTYGFTAPDTLNASVAVWDPGSPDKTGTVNTVGTSNSIIKTW